MVVFILCISVLSLIFGKIEIFIVKILVIFVMGNIVLLDRFGVEGFDLFILLYECF